MVTKGFVAKVSRIKNSKNKNYFIHRVNIPSEVIESLDLNLEKNEYLFFRDVKKAEWYHMLDWSKMNQTWDKLPKNVRDEIIADGLINSESSDFMRQKDASSNHEKSLIGTGYTHKTREELCVGSGCN